MNFYDKSFKLVEKVKVSSNRIVSAIAFPPSNGKLSNLYHSQSILQSFPFAEVKEVYFSDERSRIFQKVLATNDSPKIVFDGHIFQDITSADGHPHG